jgi:hypothetical protein
VLLALSYLVHSGLMQIARKLYGVRDWSELSRYLANLADRGLKLHYASGGERAVELPDNSDQGGGSRMARGYFAALAYIYSTRRRGRSSCVPEHPD